MALDTDLEDHLDSRTCYINMRKGWVTHINDSYEMWISTATISKLFPHSMLTLHDQHKVYLDFVKATDSLGAIFRAYEDLNSADPVNQTTHLTNNDMDLDKVRKCFKRLETHIIFDNYFRSISGLPLHPIRKVNLVRWCWNKLVPNILHHL